MPLISFKQFLDKPIDTIEEIAKKHKVDVAYVEKELKQGIKVEGEHTTHKEIARHIALAHLGEKPNYYELLRKVGG